MSKPNNDNAAAIREELMRLYVYDPQTGVFLNKLTRGRAYAGTVAGTTDKDGYSILTVFKRPMFAHRLAWLYVHGYLPEGLLDHEDRNKSNNRIGNLREVSNSCNMKNQKVNIRNTTGVTGVTRKRWKWRAYITSNGRTYDLGSFCHLADAARARWQGEQEHGFKGCCTTSSAYQYLKENNLL